MSQPQESSSRSSSSHHRADVIPARRLKAAKQLRKAKAQAAAPEPAQASHAKDGRLGKTSSAGVAELSLAGSTNERITAQRLVNQVSVRLARFERARLHGQSLLSYDQAREFVVDARQALGQQNYVSASALAKKALQLTNQLEEEAQ